MPVYPARKCRPEIFYANTDLWKWLQDYLVHFSYTDHVHGKADELEITLEDRDQVWQYIPNPTKGAAILANMVIMDWYGPGQDMTLRCGWFEIDEIEASGFPSQIRIMAHSANVTKGMTQFKKSRAWENATFRTVAQDIADEHGLQLNYDVDYDPRMKRIDQVEQPDLEFLHQHCNKWDMYLKVAENRLIIVSPSVLENGDPVNPGIDKDAIGQYRIRDKSKDTYKTCRAVYHDPKSRQLHKSEVEDPDILREGDRLDINDRMESREHAERRARKELHRRNKYECEAEFVMMGRPDLVAGVPVPVTGFGLWDGMHFIEETRHDYSQSSGYITSVRTRKGRALDSEYAVR